MTTVLLPCVLLRNVKLWRKYLFNLPPPNRAKGVWRMFWAFCGYLMFAGSTSLAGSDANSSPILGTWLTQSNSEITIEMCDMGYCGYISKIVIPQHLIDKYGKEAVEAQGEFTDVLNKDPTLRSRRIQNLQILVLHTQTAPDRMDGKIYNPENGETYEGFLEVKTPDHIRLSGCVLFNLLCMGEDWTRVASPS